MKGIASRPVDAGEGRREQGPDRADVAITAATAATQARAAVRVTTATAKQARLTANERTTPVPSAIQAARGLRRAPDKRVRADHSRPAVGVGAVDVAERPGSAQGTRKAPPADAGRGLPLVARDQVWTW